MRTDSVWPFSAATSRGVAPVPLGQLQSAPDAHRSLTISVCPYTIVARASKRIHRVKGAQRKKNGGRQEEYSESVSEEATGGRNYAG